MKILVTGFTPFGGETPVDKMIRIDVTADLLDPLVGNTLLPKENVTPDCA